MTIVKLLHKNIITVKRNIGKTDKIVRILLAILAAILIITKTFSGTWTIVAGVIGAALLVTAITGFCGLYALIGCNTCKIRQ